MAYPNDVANISRKFTLFDDLWSPKIIAESNGWHVKLVKAQGQFTWHSHEDTDEIFIVDSGQLVVELRHRKVVLGAGDMFVVPRGVEHRPDAGDGCRMLLIEPEGVPNTGDVTDEILSNTDEWI